MDTTQSSTTTAGLAPPDTVAIVSTCRCGSRETLTVRVDDYARWQAKEPIQDCFPYLTPGQRERLISGICEPCFDRMFGDDE